MDKSKLIELIEKQGFSVVLMSIMVYYLWSEQKIMQNDIKNCNDAIIELYRNDHANMREVIQQAARAMESCNVKMKK